MISHSDEQNEHRTANIYYTTMQRHCLATDKTETNENLYIE